MSTDASPWTTRIIVSLIVFYALFRNFKKLFLFQTLSSKKLFFGDLQFETHLTWLCLDLQYSLFSGDET